MNHHYSQSHGQSEGASLSILNDDTALTDLAKEKLFQQRKRGSLTPAVFLRSMMRAAQSGTTSFLSIAVLCGIQTNGTLAKQSLWQRVNPRAFAFLSAVLCRLMSSRYQARQFLTRSIKRILVADSTVVRLHPSLEPFFPGSKNQHAKTSQSSARLQVLIDIFSGDFLHFNLSSFRRNDQAAAMDVISVIRKGDLILRDLGYFTLSSLRSIHLKGCFFITRYLYKTVLYDGKGGKVDILGNLREARGAGLGKVRIHAWLGKKEAIPVLLEAVLLPAAVAAERRRKAKANRDKRVNYKADYYELLDWSIVITNIGEDELGGIDVYGLYALRWRIENIFKAWKSNLLTNRLAGHKTNVWHVKCLVVSQMIVMVKLSHLRIFAIPGKGDACPEKEVATGGVMPPGMSMFKMLNIMTLCSRNTQPTPETTLAKQLIYHAPYDKRKRMPLPSLAINFLA
jgi:hypothetical protein